jgi:lysozyme
MRISIAVSLLSVSLIIGMSYFLNLETEFEPDRKRHPLRGIDVSHHQGPIDWAAVSRDRVAFAFIKATEGGDHRDTRFKSNWTEARAAGLAVGAYHFFTLCRPGIDQARNFIEVVPKEPNALPPALDLEFPGNCPARPEPAKLKQEVEAFLSQVEGHFGRPAVLYVEDVFEAMYASALPARLRWVRSISAAPLVEDWTFWQYSETGQIDGIEKPVDLNVFQSDHSRFAELIPLHQSPTQGNPPATDF